jgi:hypothetical protein
MRISGRVCVLGLICGVAILASTGPVLAGPPFITDDPEPVDCGHWEVYGFSMATRVQGDTSGTLAGVEINYGAAPELQLHLIVPTAFDDPSNRSTQVGIGDIELGAKYRLVDLEKDDWWPQIGVFPLVEIPSGDADRGLGAGHTRAFFPVWLQKDFGDWTTYGGAGYWMNPGVGNRNYWFAGWLLQRKLTDELALGVELFHETPDTISAKDATGFNFGGIYDFNEHYHLLFSAGRGLQNMPETNEVSYYFGIQWTN